MDKDEILKWIKRISMIKHRYGELETGTTRHHGDCHIHSGAEICTCGLLHDLEWLGAASHEVAKKIYPKFTEEYAIHETKLWELANQHGRANDKGDAGDPPETLDKEVEGRAP